MNFVHKKRIKFLHKFNIQVNKYYVIRNSCTNNF